MIFNSLRLCSFASLRHSSSNASKAYDLFLRKLVQVNMEKSSTHINIHFSSNAFHRLRSHKIHVDHFQHSRRRALLRLYVTRYGLFTQLARSVHYFKFSFHIRNSPDGFCSNGVYEATVIDVSQSSVLETMIVLYRIEACVWTG